MMLRITAMAVAFIYLLGNPLTAATGSCAGKCEQSRMSHLETGMKNRAMRGHSFLNFTDSKVYDCHVKCFEEKCRCRAFQMLQDRCELLDEDMLTVPDDFEHEIGYAYFHMNREYVTCQHSCNGEVLENHCCASNPCLNGETCTESCVDANHKYHCMCTPDFTGRRCQTKMFRSCKQYLQEQNDTMESAVLELFDSNDERYQVYCDFWSESHFVWTLVESFSKENNEEFKYKPFLKNMAVNERSFSWQRYRLSFKRMNETADHSTHVRATCNYDTQGLNRTDFLKAKLSDVDVMKENSSSCKPFENIAIRGPGCVGGAPRHCKCFFLQRKHMHPHIDSDLGRQNSCSHLNGYDQPVESEDDFGYYDAINPKHSCVSTEASTTQWWLGETKK